MIGPFPMQMMQGVQEQCEDQAFQGKPAPEELKAMVKAYRRKDRSYGLLLDCIQHGTMEIIKLAAEQAAADAYDFTISAGRYGTAITQMIELGTEFTRLDEDEDPLDTEGDGGVE